MTIKIRVISAVTLTAGGTLTVISASAEYPLVSITLCTSSAKEKQVQESWTFPDSRTEKSSILLMIWRSRSALARQRSRIFLVSSVNPASSGSSRRRLRYPMMGWRGVLSSWAMVIMIPSRRSLLSSILSSSR